MQAADYLRQCAEQEPVAWGWCSSDGVVRDCIGSDTHAEQSGNYTIPLYAVPQPGSGEKRHLTPAEQDVMHSALRVSTRLIAKGCPKPSAKRIIDFTATGQTMNDAQLEANISRQELERLLAIMGVRLIIASSEIGNVVILQEVHGNEEVVLTKEEHNYSGILRSAILNLMDKHERETAHTESERVYSKEDIDTAYKRAAKLCESIAAQHDGYRRRMRINCPAGVTNPAWTCADAIRSLAEEEQK